MGNRTSLQDRFWPKVNITDGCWLWTAGKNRHGYGKIGEGGAGGRTLAAHVVSWWIACGRWPAKHILHRCDNPSCVRPDHLFEGTQLDNIRDMIRKGRRGYTGLVGTKNPKAKLSPSDVVEIRRQLSAGVSVAQIARTFHVNWTTIKNIATGLRWKSVQPPENGLSTEADRSVTTLLLPEEY